jgi:hypothetical protein
MRYITILLIAVLLGCTNQPHPPEDCNATPSCLPGHTQIPSEERCTEQGCYEAAICGLSIWCTTPDSSQCTVRPACQTGHQRVDSEADCLSRSTCYPVSLCGTTIWCTDDVMTGACQGACTPGTTCEIQPFAGSDVRSIGCICPVSGTYICDTDPEFDSVPIPCGELTCGADQYCANVCDCCGSPPVDPSDLRGHYECRPCEFGACTVNRYAEIPCA